MNIDDETYRQKLIVATGKDSCREMSLEELESAYSAFKDSGFKRRLTKGKSSHKLRANEHVRSDIILKIKAVWLEMHHHNIVRCGSMAALDQFVQRMTTSSNGGEGIARADWLTNEFATQVVEALKKWHMREMRQRLDAANIVFYPSIRGYVALAEAFNAEVNCGKITL
jgi:phage gp16-like protein